MDYVKLRDNAERAGFNPLTALRSGGAAGFTTTHHPALSSSAFIGDALGQFGNALAQIDPMREATAKLEHEIKMATLANIQADTAWTKQRASLGGVPVSTGARSVTANSALAGAPITPTIETPRVTNPYPAASGMHVNPNVPNADAFEERYGDSEAGSTIAGGSVLWQDLIYNFPALGIRNPMDETVRQVYRLTKKAYDWGKPVVTSPRKKWTSQNGPMLDLQGWQK